MASSGLAVTYAVLSGPAGLRSDTLHITGAGLVSVRATQAGNDTLNTATADMSFTVSKAAAVVTLGNLSQVYTGAAKTAR